MPGPVLLVAAQTSPPACMDASAGVQPPATYTLYHSLELGLSTLLHALYKTWAFQSC